MATALPAGKFPFEDRDAIDAFEERYWKLCKPEEVAAETAIKGATQKARHAGFLSRDLFLVIARWKSKRPTRHYVKNSEADVREASRLAFLAPTEAEAIHALTDLHGVGLRTATALLHWMRPEEFPILDFRVIGALGEKEPKSWEDVAYYSRIAARVRELARKYGVSLRELDRALWSWQKLEARKSGKHASGCP
jgi:thermostable 8-oxoguanine DNA glycosylase